jgi:hypothetical protein
MYASSNTKDRRIRRMETYLWRKLVPKDDVCISRCIKCCWLCPHLDECLHNPRKGCHFSKSRALCLYATKIYLQMFYGLSEREAFRLALEVKEGVRIHYDKKM